MKKIVFLSLCLALFWIAAESYAEPLPVIVSIYPLKDIVEQVGGDKVSVSSMVPPGATPHTFEPTPSDMIKMHHTKIFVMVGAGLEFWAEKAIKAAGRKEMRVVILSEGMPLINETHGHHEEKHNGKTIADPHLWLDPLSVVRMVDKVTAALVEADAEHKDYYRERAERFRNRLSDLHSWIMERVSTFRIREYVTFHPAWNYFSKRYGLKVAGVIEESPGKEPGPKHLARVIKEIKRTGARVVFAEPQFNPKSAEVIAKEAEVRVAFLDPIGSPDIKGRETYIDLMRYNLSVLEGAMR